MGYRQIARIYTLLRLVEHARHYGKLCLQAGTELGAEPFALGYASESVARAEMAARDWAQVVIYLEQARRICQK